MGAGWQSPWSLALVVALAACSAGSGEGLDESGRPVGEGGGGEPQPGSYAWIQANVFDLRCTGCHAGANAPLGLRLDATSSYGLLVGVPSVEVPALLRVEPGNPDDSYLVQKLEGTAAVGGQMPLSGPPVPAADILVIRQWIIDGAQADDAPAGGALRLAVSAPLPDSVLPTLPAEIVLVFDQGLDVSSVDATTVLLERSGGDGAFDDGNERPVPATARVNRHNPGSVLVTPVGPGPGPADTYRLRLRGSGPATLRDLQGGVLDGEYLGRWPSGDGRPGGDLEIYFHVDPARAPAGG